MGSSSRSWAGDWLCAGALLACDRLFCRKSDPKDPEKNLKSTPSAAKEKQVLEAVVLGTDSADGIPEDPPRHSDPDPDVEVYL